VTQQQVNIRSTGWDSFDTSSLTGLVHVPTGLQIRLGLLDNGARNPVKEWFWNQMEKRGGGLVPLGSADSDKKFEIMAKLWDDHISRGNLMERLKRRFPHLDEIVTNPNFFRRYNNRFYWKQLKRLGPHATDGSYAELELEFVGASVSMRWVQKNEDIVVVEIKAPQRDKRISLILECFYTGENKAFGFSGSERQKSVVENEPSIAFSREPAHSFSCSEYPRCIRSEIKRKKTGAEKAEYHFFVFEPGALLFVAAATDSRESIQSTLVGAEDILESSAEAYNKKCFSLNSESIFGGCAEACVRAIAWNTIYDFRKKKTFVPVSRRWANTWGGWVLYPWDTFFAAMLVSRESPGRAKDIVRTMLAEATDEGILQNYSSQFRNTPDRSQPPVGSYVILKTFFDDPDFLNEVFPALKKWHEWWMPNRDGNGDGLLEWGAGRTGNDPCRASMQGARYESGLDNSPMYDDVEFDEKSCCMKLADVGLSSLFALDAWSLSRIAEIIGNDTDKEHFFKEYAELKDRINSEMWNDEKGIYLNREWNGCFSNRLSPTCFYPMIAGIPNERQAERMVNEHLLNENEFWGEFVLPSIARNDPAFRDNNYWRGRIWGPMNFLVSEGLKRYGFYKESYELAQKSARLFQEEWRAESHIHENYNSTTGEGDDVLNSEPVYTWGALLAFLAVQEIADYEPWDGLRIGSTYIQEDTALNNCRLGKETYTIKLTEDATEIITGTGKKAVFAGKPMLKGLNIEGK